MSARLRVLPLRARALAFAAATDRGSLTNRDVLDPRIPLVSLTRNIPSAFIRRVAESGTWLPLEVICRDNATRRGATRRRVSDCTRLRKLRVDTSESFHALSRIFRSEKSEQVSPRVGEPSKQTKYLVDYPATEYSNRIAMHFPSRTNTPFV